MSSKNGFIRTYIFIYIYIDISRLSCTCLTGLRIFFILFQRYTWDYKQSTYILNRTKKFHVFLVKKKITFYRVNNNYRRFDREVN